MGLVEGDHYLCQRFNDAARNVTQHLPPESFKGSGVFSYHD